MPFCSIFVESLLECSLVCILVPGIGLCVMCRGCSSLHREYLNMNMYCLEVCNNCMYAPLLLVFAFLSSSSSCLRILVTKFSNVSFLITCCLRRPTYVFRVISLSSRLPGIFFSPIKISFDSLCILHVLFCVLCLFLECPHSATLSLRRHNLNKDKSIMCSADKTHLALNYA